MSEEMAVFADDEIVAIARQAQARIQAIIQIKQMSLSATEIGDWIDQDGKPYLQVSGAEKVGGLFKISWSFIDPEPLYEEDLDGHYTYTYRGEFRMAGRTIQVEGSRSSKDKFFSQYVYEEGKNRETKDVKDRDNKRDVKMAAYTNLLGNGITRMLGIRNLSYEDLEKYAGIKRENIKGVKYRKPDMKEPGEKSKDKEEIITSVLEIRKKIGKGKTGKDFTIFTIKGETAEYSTFSETFATLAKEAKEANKKINITFNTDQYGNKAENVVIYEEPPEETERQPGGDDK